jgi:hypothetical protein
MRKQEIYVEITTEKERLRAIEILEKAGESVLNCSRLYKKDKTGNLSFSEQWSLPSFMFQLPRNMHQITLSQLEEMLIPIQYELVGECKGNNDDGCFMNSCGHNCGCFEKIPKSIIGTQSNNPLFVAQRYIIDNFPEGTVVTITNGLIEVK